MKTLTTLIAALFTLSATPALAAPVHSRQPTQASSAWNAPTKKGDFVGKFGDALRLSPRQSRTISRLQMSAKRELAPLKQQKAELTNKLAQLQARRGRKAGQVRHTERQLAFVNQEIKSVRQSTRAAIKDQLSPGQLRALARIQPNKGTSYGSNKGYGKDKGYGKKAYGKRS